MPNLVSSHHLVLQPDHRVLLLRDIDCDAGVGATAAIVEAHASVAASSGYGVYVNAVQGFIPLRIEVEVWDSQPGSDPPAGEWTGPVRLQLDCPTGHLQAGDDMGNAMDGIDPPQGPGRYGVAVYHHGRDEALELQRQAESALSTDDRGARADELRELFTGRERYLFRLWWQEPLPVDEDEDDWA